VVLSGKYTSLFDFPILGKFISSNTRFDVAPESITSHLLSILVRVPLLLLVFTISCFTDIWYYVGLFDIIFFFMCVVVEWGPVVRGGQVRVIHR